MENNILIWFISINLILSLDIKLNDTKIFHDGSLHSHFNFSLTHKSSDCMSGRDIFFETKEIDITELAFIKSNQTDNYSIINTTSSNDMVEVVLDTLKANDTYSIIQLIYYCNASIESKIKWSEIKLNFEYNNQFYILKLLKFCETPHLFESIISGLILFAVATIILIIASCNDIKFDVDDLREQGELKAWHGLFFVFFGSITLMLIFYFIEYANVIITCIISVQSIVALFLTLKTVTENFDFLNKNEFLKRKLTDSIDYLSMVLVSISLIVVMVWLFTKHWFLNDFLGFCLIFTILSILHINNFRVCAIILGCTFLYDVFWVFFSPAIFSKNVMETAAIKLNLPIKLEMPIFLGNNPIKDCVFLGLGDIVIPGLLVKFCRNFDIAKKINVYFITAVTFYVIGILTCGAVLVIFNYPQPALFYLCPSLILSITCISCSRKEFKEIWLGCNNTSEQDSVVHHNLHIDDIFSDEFKDNTNINDIIDNSSHNL